MKISGFYEVWLYDRKWSFCNAHMTAEEYEIFKSDEKTNLFTISYSCDGFTYVHGDMTAYPAMIDGELIYNIPLSRFTVVLRAPDVGIIAQLRQKDRGTK